MNVVRWSPFREFDNLFQALERPSAPVRRADWLPLVDIRETQSDYQIDVEVPAVAAEDLSVNVNEGVLTVSGERKSLDSFSSDSNGESESETKGKVHRVERRFGRFVRNFQLPEDADADAIHAHSKDGVLYLKIAKREPEQGRTINIEVSS